MGITAQQMLQNDPEYLARQLAQQEIKQYQNIQNPMLGAASTAGALLGRGIGNLVGGRGFFDVADPALRRVADTQRVFNDAMASFDPANPAASYEAMARKFSEMGYGQQAMLAAQEAAKYRKDERAEARAAAADDRANAAERRAAYTFNPQLAIQDAANLPEDDPKRIELLSLASRLMTKDNYDIATKQAQINASEAQAASARAQADKAKAGDVSESVVTEDGKPLQKRGGKYYTMDGKVYMGKVQKLTSPSEAAQLIAAANAAKGLGGGGGGTTTGTPYYNQQTGKIEYR